MMKKWLTFVLGIITGAVISICAIGLINHKKSNAIKGVRIFDQPRDEIYADYFEVEKVIDDHAALVYSMHGVIFSEQGNLYLLLDKEGDVFYDGQIIEIPKDSEARQVGVYKYKDKVDDDKTVAVIEIMPK